MYIIEYQEADCPCRTLYPDAYSNLDDAYECAIKIAQDFTTRSFVDIIDADTGEIVESINSNEVDIPVEYISLDGTTKNIAYIPKGAYRELLDTYNDHAILYHYMCVESFAEYLELILKHSER